MTHNTTTTTTGNVLPPGAKLCAGLRGGTDCPRGQTCARHTEIETTPGAVMVFASICGAADWAGYVKAAS